MAELTRRYALPLLQSGQSQKEVTHNEALAALDTLLHLSVASRTLAAPPPSPTDGVAWIVGPAPTGEWTGKAGLLASFQDAGWRYLSPADGCLAWLVDEGVYAIYAAGTWQADAWPVRALLVGERKMLAAEPQSVSPVVGGSVVDVQARAALLNVVNVLRAMGIVTPA